MKKTFIYTALTVVLAFTFGSFQGLQAATEIQKDDKVFDMVETPPQFVGGDVALYEYLSKSIQYPAVAHENNIQGRVIVQFIVDEKGKVINPKIIRGVDPSLDSEALRVVNAMPVWKPGLQKGKAVKVRYTLPINFNLGSNQPKTNVNKPAETPVKIDDGKQHLATSKGLVGLWRQSGITEINGEISEVLSGNYKVINPDGTFYTFITWGEKKPTQIGLYGTYIITSDSTYTEQIIQHGINPRMNGTSSELRYKMIDENTLLIEYKNEAINKWIPEIWRRVEMAKIKVL